MRRYNTLSDDDADKEVIKSLLEPYMDVEYAERYHPDALLIDTGNFKNKS